MDIDKKFKSTLVVWYGQELPVIETFYADTEDEILSLQQEWMKENDYEKGNMHLYERSDGEWQSVQQCEFCRMPTMPEFVFIQCSPHESQELRQLLNFYTVLQVETGRIVKIVPVKKNNGDGVFKGQLVYTQDGIDIAFTVSILKMCDEDHEMLEDGDFEDFSKMMGESLIKPLATWFYQHLEFMGKHKKK